MDTASHIKAVAIDLDGTLLTSEKHITPYTIEILQAVMGKGVKVAIATGRSLATAIRFVDQVGTTFPLICYNGSCIWDPITGKDLWNIALQQDVCEEIVRVSKQTHTHLHAFQDHDLLFTEQGRHADYLEPLSAVIGKAVDFTSLSDLRFTKAMFIGDYAETERIRLHLKSMYGDKLHLVYSHKDYFEIMTGGATKGTALQRLMDRFGISADETVAFGDADNDKEMLAWARHGFAMGNAHDEVKSIAYGIAGHNDEDGVARMLAGLFGISGS